MMENGKRSADRFIRLLERGTIRKNILPNTSDDYSQVQEQVDLVRYKIYLQSFAYDDINECEVRCYYGD